MGEQQRRKSAVIIEVHAPKLISAIDPDNSRGVAKYTAGVTPCLCNPVFSLHMHVWLTARVAMQALVAQT